MELKGGHIVCGLVSRAPGAYCPVRGGEVVARGVLTVRDVLTIRSVLTIRTSLTVRNCVLTIKGSQDTPDSWELCPDCPEGMS